MQAAARRCAVKSEAHRAAIKIQAGARYRLEWLLVHGAATALQAVARGKSTRAAFDIFVCATFSATIVVQRAVRGFLVLRRQLNLLKQDNSSGCSTTQYTHPPSGSVDRRH